VKVCNGEALFFEILVGDEVPGEMGTGRRLAPEGLKAFVQRRRNAGCKPARAEMFFSMGRPEASRDEVPGEMGTGRRLAGA
jgi:hypothetical protein